MPVKSQSSPVDGGILASATVIPSSPRSRTTVSAVLRWAGFTITGPALIDSGAEGNFIDEKWASERRIPLLDLDETTTVFALDGRVLSSVHRITSPVSLTVSGNHRETISFFVFQSPYTPIVLGHPWLTRHNPQIDWVKGSILSWNLSCHVNCLLSAVPAVSSVSVFQEEPGDLSGVPEEYHDLRAVFSRSSAGLPPCLLIVLTIAALSSFRAPCHPAVDYTRSRRPSGRLWRNTSQSPSPRGLLFRPPLLPVRGSS